MGGVGIRPGRARRLVTRCVVTLVATVGVIALSQSPAIARTTYPSGCFSNLQYNYKGWWPSTNCWMGGSYWTDGDAIRLPQWMAYWATGGACNAGIVDGVIGPTTTNAIKCYQGKRGLVQDGIIGGGTWGKFANDALVSQCVGSPYPQCAYYVGASKPLSILIRYTPNNPDQDNWIYCTQSIGYYSIFPYLNNGTTGKYASQCPGSQY
jgi:peptidoglycan hydrolase-like protein with peptidoglycan-binding domain